MTNVDEVRARLGIVREFAASTGVDRVKVAVLDTGFDGIGPGRSYLPADAELVAQYDPEFVRKFDLGDPEYRKDLEPGNRHGRVMAQIVWAVSGKDPRGPKFYLLNANGPTMLRRAVRLAIERRVDVILFSGSFEGGGSGDGRGPINRVAADALAAGIVWINAAGNYGRRVYEGPVRILNDGYLRLRDGSDVASLRFRNRLDDNGVTITLTWNDYRDMEDAGTTKDLDLLVEDPAGRRVGAGEKVQVGPGPGEPGPEESRNPRERVVLANLPAAGDVANDPDYAYRIRVRAKGGSFDARDRIRILLTPTRESYLPPGADAPREAIEFVDASNEAEVYPPADNPLVLTVGDADPASSLGPTVDRRVKPDTVVADSRAYFSDGEVSAGSSNSAAFVAGAVVLLKAAAPSLRPADLLKIAREGDPVPASAVRSRTGSSGQSTTTVTAVLRSAGVPAPRAPVPAAVPKVIPSPGFHYWRMPTRARLAQISRDGR